MTLFGEVRRASSLLAVSSLSERRAALASISRLLDEEKALIKEENDKDLENAEKELAKMKEENNNLQMQIVKLETEMKNRRK